MADFRLTVSEFQKGIELDAGRFHRIVLLPDALRVSFRGMFFDTNKNFVLPSVIAHLRGAVETFQKFPEAKILIVGHTDTRGDTGFNDILSLERAKSVAAFLKDDVDAWLERYESSVTESKRWGAREDQVMLRTLQIRGFLKLPAPTDTNVEGRIKAAQEQLGVTVDGKIGPKTRRALIAQYMAEDDTTLPPSVEVTIHGCGEHFPLDDTGLNLEGPGVAQDSKEDAVDRRVELFFFNAREGIQPPPPGPNSKKNSPEYPEWRRRATVRNDVFIPPGKLHAAKLPSRFSRASTFPKPALLDNLRAMMQLLRDDPMLDAEVVGFSDTIGDADQNLAIAENRARSVVAFMTGDADYFRARFNSPDPVRKWDWEEVQWMLSAVNIAEVPCYIGVVDGQAGPATHEALAKLQVSQGLAPTGLADDETLAVLISEYLKLGGEPIHAFRLFASGGGAQNPLRKFSRDADADVQDDAPQRARRVEIFALEGRMAPPASTLVTDETAHETWCKQVVVERSLPRSSQLFARVVDEERNPMPNQTIRILESTGDAATVLASLTSDQRGIVRLQLEPGYYAVEASLGERELRSGLSVDPDEYGPQTIALASAEEG